MPVSFTVVSGPATLSGNTVTLTGAGTVVVRALQPGDENYEAALSVDQSFMVAGSTELSGVVLDGYVAQGLVFLDTNGNRRHDPGEPSTRTDSKGGFHLEVDLGNYDSNHNGRVDPVEGTLVVIGGVDIATGLPLELTLTAPAGAGVVNPLTTVLTAMLEQSSDLSMVNAQAVLKTALEIPGSVDLLQFDPYAAGGANGSSVGPIEGALIKVQDTTVAIAAVLAGGQASEQIGQTITATLARSVTGQIEPLDLSHAATVKTLIEQAAGNLGATLDPTITAASAEIIAQLNQETDRMASQAILGPLGVLEEMSRVATFSQGQVAEDLGALGNGSLPPAEALQRYSGEALREAAAGTPFGDVSGSETRPGTFSFSRADFRVREDGRAVMGVAVIRMEGNVGAAEVMISLSDGTASRAGGDYAGSTIPVRFADRQIITNIDLSSVVRNDSEAELEETVELSLSLAENAPAGARIGSRSRATLTIVNDDAPLRRPRLGIPTRQSDQQFKVTVAGEPGRVYRLEGSTNLIDWTTVSERASNSEVVEFVDPASDGLSQRFYRVSVR